MADTKISAGADPVTVVATDKVPMARSASTTAYAATMAELATYANGAYTPNYFAGTPSMDGTGAAGTAAFVARGDHVHPSDTARVAKGGDTMTGLLTLSGAPTSNLHAATKLYVDGSSPVGGPYLPLAGVTNGSNATAGNVGEVIQSQVLSASAIAAANVTQFNLTSIALTAGDWDVAGLLVFQPVGAATIGQYFAGISTVSATLPDPSLRAGGGFATPANISQGVTVMPTRISIAAAATAYLVGYGAVAGGTMVACGMLWARRAR